MDQSPLDLELISFADELADTARGVSLRYFRQPFTIEKKQDLSPVTTADRETETLLRSRIRNRFPNHGVLGEEYGLTGNKENPLWVIDPIDGTKAFVSGLPTFSTLIALLKGNKPALGVMDFPALNERWAGYDNQSTLYNGGPVRTNKTNHVEDAVVYASSPDMFNQKEKQKFNALTTQTRFHGFGTDAYAYGLLASGFIEYVMEASMKPYDYLALVPVVKGAGGLITDWQGNELLLGSSGQVLASANAAMHDAALEIINND